MIKWISSKIGVKLLITFSVVLVLSMASLIYIATQMVAEFGEFSASGNEANIRDNANAFLARITHEQAMRYDSVFKKFAASSALIAKQAAFLLENITLYGKTPLKPNEKLVIYPHNGIFSNDRSEKTMVLYWGSPTMSPEISEQINTLSHLDSLLETVKEGNSESAACYVVTEPGISRYYPNIHGVEKLPPTTKFDVRNANWYVIAKPENNPERKTVWSNIYLDSVGQGLLITASTPVYSKSGQYIGAAGVDVTLDTIVNDILAHIPSCHRMEDIFSFLVDNQGRLIAFPPEYLDMFEIKIDRDKLVDATIILKHSLLESSNLEIRKIGESILEKKYQVSNFVLNGRPYIISSHFMPSTGWCLGTVVPESVILASVQETRNALDSTVKSMTTRLILVTILFLIVSIIVVAILSIINFIRPLGKLSKGALRVKEGDLTTYVDVHTKDEIGSLSQSFNNMVDALRKGKESEKAYTEKLEQNVNERTSELRIKNEELKKTRERLELAMDAGEHGFWDWNLDTDDVYFSPRYYTMLGYEPGELPMKLKTWVNLMHPDDQKTIVPEVENYVKNAQAYEVEFRLKTKDGDWKWVSGRGKSYKKDVDGIPHRAVGVHVDITSRKQAEDALRGERDRAQMYLDIAGVMFVAIDASGEVTLVNKKGCEILGYDEKQILGKNWFNHFLPEAQREEVKGVFQKLMTREIELFEYFENPVINKSGDERCIAWHNTLLKNENGDIIGTFSSGEDITDRKVSDKERIKLEAQLQQAQKMEAIGTLAGGIAHDFNNILFPIVGYAEMGMLEVSEDSKIRKNLIEILSASKRASDLVQQILTFSRQHDQELKPLKAQLVVREALKLIRSSLPTTIEIDQDIEKDCGLIMADPTRIHQVVMNLCTNAYHAMEETGGALKVNLKEMELMPGDLIGLDMEPGPYLCLTVSDTGKGMDNSTIERIFDPYFTTKEKGKGTGLGLAVVHGIVKGYSGDIRVYSESGKGTSFHVYLPVIKTGILPSEIVSDEPLPTGHEHILLIDDETQIIDMEKQMLERLGYQVTVRTSSIDALEAFKASPAKFDLVITNMTMPNMTGDKLTGKLKNIRPDIPVILCTGFSEKISRESADALGVAGFLMKPILMKDLAKTIRMVLDE